jgi:hypothetical protein
LEADFAFSATDSNEQTVWVADAYRDEGKRFVVRADELLTAFMELETAIRACGDYRPALQTVLINH